MSIFSRKPKHNRAQDSRKQAKLSVLATKSQSPTDAQSTEWILEVSIPASNATLDEITHEHKRSLFSRRSTSASSSPPTSPTQAPVVPATSTSPKVLYFSRLDTQGSTALPTQPIALRIFLSNIHSTSPLTTLREQIAEALSIVHITPDADSYLRQALYSLQSIHMIPGLSHGLDINKFISFANSYPTSPVPEANASLPTETVNYSRIVHDNARLKRMFHSENTDYSVINAETSTKPPNLADGDDDTEDCWNVPASHAKPNEVAHAEHKKGFWFTYGSEALSLPERRRNSSARQYEQSNVYGGLM